MGLKPIMSSKRIIIMGKGEKKKDILMRALHGDITEEVPASILQKHKNVEVIYCD
jgi:glucosamine-6-phosphate deaminase